MMVQLLMNFVKNILGLLVNLNCYVTIPSMLTSEISNVKPVDDITNRSEILKFIH